jgi:hypothetical protein
MNRARAAAFPVPDLKCCQAATSHPPRSGLRDATMAASLVDYAAS